MNISVIIPVYNAEQYVEKAIQSALQFPEVKEIIIVEDGSPDNALEVCEKWQDKDSRIKVFRHPNGENRGAGASRNLGLMNATQDYVAFLDADDYYLPNRFDAERKLFQNPEVEGVYGAIGVEYYSEKAKEQFFSIYGNRLDTVYKSCAPQEVFPGQIFLRGSFGLIILDTLTIKREALQTHALFFNEGLKLHQDTDFTVRVSYYLQLYPGIIDKAVAIRGVHENNRITKVESKKISPSSTRIKLWKSLYDWAKEETTMPEKYISHIKNMYQSFVIAESNFPKNWVLFLKEVFTNFPAAKSGLYNIHYRQKLFFTK